MSVASDFQFKEKISYAGGGGPANVWPQPNAAIFDADLQLPVDLTDRRIYCYAEVSQAIANSVFAFRMILELVRGNTVVAKYPVEIGISAGPGTNPPTFANSLQCLANAGGSPVGDCLTLVLANPFTTTTVNAILQPIRLQAQIDSARLRMVDRFGAQDNGWRVYLGVLSQKGS